MNPNTNTIIGRPITNTKDTNTLATPNSAPDGIVAPVAVVMLVVILAASGKALINENNGENAAARTNPAIIAQMAPIADVIRENEITGIFKTSFPSNSNLIPPNLGTSRLYSIAEKKLATIVKKNAPIGSNIIKGTPNPVATLKFPNSGINPATCTITSPTSITNAAMNPKIPYITADILVKGVSFKDLISFISTIF